MCSEADRPSIIELLNFEIFDYTNAISTSGVTVSAFMVLGFFWEILANVRGFTRALTNNVINLGPTF